MSSIQAPGGERSIAVLSRKVVTILSALSDKLDCENERPAPAETPTLKKETERFKIWLDEQDVYRGTLDHRLRESSVLRERVITLLEKLCGKLRCRA